jgi:hypothetical protein
MTGKKSERTGFVRGNARLGKLLARPDIAAGVAEIEAEAREMDRVYAENLAMIRRASDVT